MDIIKPNNENREFKIIYLDNKIKCTLINDPNLNKSYFVNSINIGSLANKKYYEGIAHLLEHMCFITSAKYQEPNYIQNKVTEFGGWTNAYTDTFNTVYYLNVFTQHLSDIIEIFVDYLINAELKEEFILNEMKNVDSEHKKNLNNDLFKHYNLLHLLSESNSNYHSFFTGSLETLNKKDIYEKIVEFYKKYYAYRIYFLQLQHQLVI
jgi:insulysin